MCSETDKLLKEPMDIEGAQKTFRWKHNRHQYLATFSANLLTMSQGCVLGWVSPALPLLISEQTPLLTGPLTNEQTSWIGSINCVGSFIGALSFGYISTLLGYKRAVLIGAVPILSFWLLIFFGNTYHSIFIARLIGGIGGGGLRGVTILFISEIANDNIRGRLGSVMVFSQNVGTLIGYVLGAGVQYNYIPFISSAILIVSLIIFIMIPNTPQYYLREGQTQKAENALKFYKGYQGNNHREDDAIFKEFERLKTIANERKKDKGIKLTDFFTEDALKGLAIGIALTIFVQCSASFTITTYAVMTFTKVGTNWDPYISSIVLALTLILGSLTTTYLADKLGRRKLNLISLLGCALGLFSTSLYYYLNLCGYDLSASAWFPVLSLSFVVFLSSAGITQLALICSVEYLRSRIRTYGMAIITCSLGVTSFISTKMYPILLASLDLHGCLMIYGIGCIIGFIFVLFVLKETNGKSLDDPCTDKK